MKNYIELRKKGDEFLKQGEYQNAIEQYKQAILNNNKYSTAYAHLGEALLKQGELCKTLSEQVNYYDNAIKQCKEALSIKKSYVYAYRIEGDSHKSKAGVYLNSKDFLKCQEESEKAEECYNSAIKYAQGEYQIGKMRLSELQAFNELLKQSIASKSIASNLDAEFDEDEDENIETAEKKGVVSATDEHNHEQTQLKVARLLEALSTGNYTDFASAINEGIDISVLKALNDWNESVLGNVLSLSDKIAMDILRNKFFPSQIEITKLISDNPEYTSIEGGLCHTMIAIDDVKEFLGHFYSNVDELC